MNLERTTGSRRLGWVSLLGALLVPIMLAAGFLAATWNSQSRWDKVQAAIVNQDQPVKINGRLVPLGRQLASGLVKGGGKDHQDGKQNFDWVITDASDAGKGLADGRYAAVVTIPKAFSKDATSYAANKGDQAEQATLGVQTSKVSGVTDAAIAQAISSTAVGSLNNQLTKQYLDNLYLGFNQTQQGFKKSADGASGLSKGAGQIRAGLGKSADGATKLATGMGRLSNGTTKLSDGLGQTDTAVGQLATGITGLHNGIAQTNAGVGKLDNGVGKLADGMDSYTTGAGTFAKGVKKYTGGVSKLTGNLGPYADGVSSYVDGVDKYVAGVNQYASGVGDYVDGVGTAADQVAAKVGGAGVSQAQVDQVCTAAGFHPSSAECAGVAVGMKAGMQAGADGTAAGIKQAVVASGDPANPSAGEQLKAGATTITDSGSKITSGGTDLANGSTQLSSAAGKLGKAGDQIATGAAGLASGAKKIDKGLQGVHTGTTKLAGGTGKLEAGAAQLDTGGQQLATGMVKLADAGHQLADGTAQSATGAGQLSGGLSKLSDGGNQLANGAGQLASGLNKAAAKLPTYSSSDRKQLSDAVSAPVSDTQPDGLFANQTTTTLLMAVALWVGGLATYLIVRAIGSDAFGSQKSSVRLALEGVAPGVIIGAAQAVILSIMMGVLLKLSAEQTFGLLGFSAFAAVTFAVLNQALVAWLGGVGRFISLAVVVMAAAGSLTNALPDFFSSVRPYLPTTPALDGVRMIVTGGPSVGNQVAVLLGWLAVAAIAAILAVSRRRVAASVLAPAR